MSFDLIANPEKAKDVWDIAVKFSESKLIPYNLIGKPSDVLVIMMTGYERNIPMTTALQEIAVINGKPTISVNLMTGLIRSKLPDAIIQPKLDFENEVVEVYCARSEQRSGEGFSYTAKWDKKRAELMGLLGKDNYKKQFMNMLRCRATAEACRVVFSDIILGLYAPEEFYDIEGKVIKTVNQDQIDFDEAHPIPDEEKEIGSPEYRFQFRKFANKQMKDIEVKDLEDRLDYLEKKMDKNNGGDDKDKEETLAIRSYLLNIEKEAMIDSGLPSWNENETDARSDNE